MRILEHGGRSLIIFGGTTDEPMDSMLRKAAGMSNRTDASVRLLDSRRVFGPDHIRSALMKAVRAFENGQNVSDSLATETILYMSGRRQIQEAVALLGLKMDTESIVCVADLAEGIKEKLAKELSIREDESIIASGQKDLSGFGISAMEISTLPDEKRDDLVLERVASVDIRKK
jgi:KEOPS complex subunit Cgi121